MYLKLNKVNSLIIERLDYILAEPKMKIVNEITNPLALNSEKFQTYVVELY